MTLSHDDFVAIYVVGVVVIAFAYWWAIGSDPVDGIQGGALVVSVLLWPLMIVFLPFAILSVAYEYFFLRKKGEDDE